ncbi:MAG TPA: TIM-barrel domain-containing protein, partial [Flavisolibacter sp.]|nr:TIM-barrel domain-containing protein [Flavisolibacter sp.]
MEKFYLLIICIISSISGQAQFKKDFAFGNRKYSVQYFDSNIIRITHYYAAETKRENISDAVILKPLAKASKYQAALVEDALVIPFRNGEIVINSDSVKRLNFRLRNNEKIFGGGERALPLNRRGYRLTLYNNPWYGYSEGADNLNYSVPFITSSLGYGLFFDNPSKGYVDIGKTKEDVLEYSTLSGEVVVYIIFGDYKTILQSYHKLTGKQPLPPLWALGNLMSRFGYTSEAQVKSIYQKMKEEGVPVDAVIFDLFWFGDSIKGTMGNLEWVNRNAWPDPRKMIAGFKKEDVQTILVTEPFFVETAKNYTASKPYLAV